MWLLSKPEGITWRNVKKLPVTSGSQTVRPKVGTMSKRWALIYLFRVIHHFLFNTNFFKITYLHSSLRNWGYQFLKALKIQNRDDDQEFRGHIVTTLGVGHRIYVSSKLCMNYKMQTDASGMWNNGIDEEFSPVSQSHELFYGTVLLAQEELLS